MKVLSWILSRFFEPKFTLLARDPNAPGVVRQWAYERERSISRGEKPYSDKKKVLRAYKIAAKMEGWRKENKK